MVQQTETINPKKRGPKGSRLKPDEHKVKVFGYVMKKHWLKAQTEITAHCKQYR